MEKTNKVPRLRFPGFERAWEETRLEKITSVFQSGKNITAKDISKDGHYPVYGGNGLRGYTSSFNHKGTFILIGRQGALCGNITLVHGKTFVSEHAIAVQANNHSDDRWLAQRLEYMNLNRYSESSAQPGLAVNKLVRFKINIPSLPEQQKIAEFLSAVDDKIQQLQKKKDLLEQYKKGVMQGIFNQEIRFKDDLGNEYPDWKKRRLKDLVISISNGLSLNQNTSKKGVMVTRIETISNRHMNLSKVGYVDTMVDISHYKLDVGDILFSNINSVSHIGKLVMVDKDYNLYHGMNLLRIRVDPARSDPSFVAYRLGSYSFKKHFEKICNRAVNQASINQSDLQKTLLEMPPLPEQGKIAHFLSAIDDKLTLLDNVFKQSRSFKKGLLQQMFV